MSTLFKLQCKNIRSHKFPDERCKYTTATGDFCSRHQKNPRIYKPLIENKPIISAAKSVKKIQGWWRRLNNHRILKDKSPAFFNRNLCHNESELATFEPLTTIPRDYFFILREHNRIWGFDIRTLITQYEHDGHLENPYTKELCSPEMVDHFRRSVDILRKWKKPLQYEVITGLSNVQNWNLRVLDMCLRLDMLGYRIATQWFSDLDISSHRKLYIQLHSLWTEEIGLTPDEKERIVPRYLAEDFKLFKWLPAKVFSKTEIDSIRRTNLNIMERLISSATQQSDKTLGAMYSVMAMSRVSYRCRQAYPWLSS
jgi:hypothetical protein